MKTKLGSTIVASILIFFLSTSITSLVSLSYAQNEKKSEKKIEKSILEKNIEEAKTADKKGVDQKSADKKTIEKKNTDAAPETAAGDGTPSQSLPQTKNPEQAPKAINTPSTETKVVSAVPSNTDYPTKQPNTDYNGTSHTYATLLQTIIVLLIIAAVLFFVIRFLKKRRGVTFVNNDAIKILASSSIALNKYIQIIQIGKTVRIVGVTDQNVSALGEITDPETIEILKMSASRQIEPNFQKTLSGILSNVFPNAGNPPQNKQDGSIFGFLRKQKERLQK